MQGHGVKHFELWQKGFSFNILLSQNCCAYEEILSARRSCTKWNKINIVETVNNFYFPS
jgi:hypothetical protein